MSGNDNRPPIDLTRRNFLTAVAAATAGTASPAMAAPRRGGTLRFGTRVDGDGLDGHRNIVYYVSDPFACTAQGLLDLDRNMNIVPGVAEAWEMSKDMTRYTFRLRKGVEYHNGADVDAASVKWNYERILDPKIGHPFIRSSFEEVERIEADGKHVVHIHLKRPSAVFAANVVFFPVILMAPNSVDQADTMPIGCGPFRFVSWKRYAKGEFVRFPNYFETGIDGKSLPYLDAIEGYPKREDKVRLTALRTGEIDLIDNMPFSDVKEFQRDSKNKFTTWEDSKKS